MTFGNHSFPRYCSKAHVLFRWYYTQRHFMIIPINLFHVRKWVPIWFYVNIEYWFCGTAILLTWKWILAKRSHYIPWISVNILYRRIRKSRPALIKRDQLRLWIENQLTITPVCNCIPTVIRFCVMWESLYITRRKWVRTIQKCFRLFLCFGSNGSSFGIRRSIRLQQVFSLVVLETARASVYKLVNVIKVIMINFDTLKHI